MWVHRRRRATRYAAAIPVRPSGSGGVGPSASLPRLDDALASDFVAAPRIRPHGVRNAARPNTRTGSCRADPCRAGLPPRSPIARGPAR